MSRTIKGAARAAPLAWPAIVEKYGALLPPYPGPELAARKPEPPQLVVGPIDTQVYALMQAYTCAVRFIYGSCREFGDVFDSDDARDSQHYLTLAKAAPLFALYKVSPVVWVRFSIDVWLTYGPGKKRKSSVPTVNWTFSVNRLKDRQEWLQWFEAHVRGGQLSVSEPHKRASELYTEMRNLLLLNAKQGTLTRHTAELLAEQFTGRIRKLSAVADEIRSRNEQVWRKAIKRGEYIWT